MKALLYRLIPCCVIVAGSVTLIQRHPDSWPFSIISFAFIFVSHEIWHRMRAKGY